MSNKELEMAKAAMKNSQTTAPVEYKNEEPEISAEEKVELEMANRGTDMPESMDMAEITVTDFLETAKRDAYVLKEWKEKNKKIKIKKFTKGDLDRVSSPLMKKTISVKMEVDQKNQTPTLDISMETFGLMEKIMVEVGLSYYQSENQPVITMAYIDKVMTDDVFKELSALVLEVNPNAMAASAKTAKDGEGLKN